MSVSPNDQDLSNDTTFSQILSRVLVPLSSLGQSDKSTDYRVFSSNKLLFLVPFSSNCLGLLQPQKTRLLKQSTVWGRGCYIMGLELVSQAQLPRIYPTKGPTGFLFPKKLLRKVRDVNIRVPVLYISTYMYIKDHRCPKLN